jgi:hypothetical protein
MRVNSSAGYFFLFGGLLSNECAGEGGREEEENQNKIKTIK